MALRQHTVQLKEKNGAEWKDEGSRKSRGRRGSGRWLQSRNDGGRERCNQGGEVKKGNL